MKKKLASLAAAMALTAVMGGTAMAAEGSLADVPKDHWSYEAVNQLVKDGIIEGMPDGTYAGGFALIWRISTISLAFLYFGLFPRNIRISNAVCDKPSSLQSGLHTLLYASEIFLGISILKFICQ